MILEYSDLANDIFERVQRGKENSFFINLGKGIPGTARCGGDVGEIVLAHIALQSGENPPHIFSEKGAMATDTVCLLIDSKRGEARCSLITENGEILNTEGNVVSGILTVVATQRSGTAFVIQAIWTVDDKDVRISSMLVGSDEDYINFAISNIYHERGATHEYSVQH